MRLYLAQHAQALTKEQDPERRLSPAGVEEAGRAAAWARAAGLRPDAIWHSGKARAAQTAVAIAEALGASGRVEAIEGIAPNDDPAGLLDRLPEEGEVLVVGHLPHLARVAGLALCGDASRTPVAFHNAGIVCLVRIDRGWALEWAVTPALAAAARMVAG